MPRFLSVALLLVLAVSSPSAVSAQEGHAATTDRPQGLKTVVVEAKRKSDSEIAVPPATSVQVKLRPETYAPSGAAVNLFSWITWEATRNGLHATDLLAWHIVVTYDQYDEDGDNVNSGTYEEFWAGPKKYKRIYESDNLKQTDYATDRGLFRHGDQRWPGPAERQVRASIVDPFFDAAELRDFHATSVERNFSGHTFQCLLIERNPGAVSDPTQYCFEPGGSILRYSRGDGWLQTTYNQIELFQGRNVARDLEVTDGGKPYLKLHVKTLELISVVSDADFAPTADAVGPMGDRISGVNPTLIGSTGTGTVAGPRPPRGQVFRVEVEVVVGKDGHVLSAHAVSGPEEARGACENHARTSVYAPYLVLDQPVEVEMKFVCEFH